MDFMDNINSHIRDWADLIPPYMVNGHNGLIQLVDHTEEVGDSSTCKIFESPQDHLVQLKRWCFSLT
jgi:hypothetical protein